VSYFSRLQIHTDYSPRLNTLKNRFDSLIEGKIWETRLYETPAELRNSWMKAFSGWIHAGFSNNGQSWSVEIFPGSDYDIPGAGIYEGHITFSNEEVLSLFEPVSHGLLELVRRQLLAIWDLRETVQMSA
jgi:hypothetical protein